MLRVWISVVAGLLGLVASLVAVLTWGVWPIGTVIVLAVLVIASVVVAVSASRRGGRASDTPAAARDARIVREIQDAVPRHAANWLRDWDFGAGWRSVDAEHVYALAQLDNEERVPHNRRLRRARRRLLDAADAFTRAEAQHGFPERGGGARDWRNVGWSGGEADGLRGRQRALWEERRTILNDASAKLASEYDRFIQVARSEHLLDAN